MKDWLNEKSVGVATVVLESKTFLDYVSGSRVQFRPVASVSCVLGILCLTQMLIFYGKWFLWVKVWEERARRWVIGWYHRVGSIFRRFISFKKYDRMIKEEDTSIAMAKIGNFRKFCFLEILDDLEIKKWHMSFQTSLKFSKVTSIYSRSSILTSELIPWDKPCG